MYNTKEGKSCVIYIRVSSEREEALPRKMLLRKRITFEHALGLHFIEIRPCVERPELRMRLPEPSGDLTSIPRAMRMPYQ